jgi:DinB family protein
MEGLMRKVTATAAAALLLAGVAHAQPGNPLGQALATEAHANMSNMVSAAEAMPAEKYGFKFETNTFGDLIYHAAFANNMLCAMMTGETTPETTVKAGGQKEALIDQLKQSFAYCDRAFEKIDASKLGQSAKFMTRDVTVAWVIVHAALDWGDHYAQVARMLRANGITPPSAQRRTQ